MAAVRIETGLIVSAHGIPVEITGRGGSDAGRLSLEVREARSVPIGRVR